MAKGEQVPWNKGQSILSESDIDECVRLYTEDLWTLNRIAAKYYVNTSTIRRYLLRREVTLRPAGGVGSLDVPTKLIVRLKEKEGLSYRKIAARTLLGQGTVQKRYEKYLRDKAKKN